MTPNTTKEEAIFLATLEKGSRQERQAYLESACGGDAALLGRVRELLSAHDGDSGPLDATLPGVQPATQRDAIERPGTRIGPYKLLQVIGEGGMGVVYMASQREPVERTVALKIIKPGMDSRQVIARFEAERQALALMDQEASLSPVARPLSPLAGRPYFVMELVKGVPITQYCDEHHLTARQRLELFVPVCQAIQHAHQKGIIHRDIKPTNILVAEYDQQPVPKIIDFGVAKAIGQRLTEKTMFTEFGQVVGTIEYMSPEQAKLNQLDIDTRTDIYSLGVLLYELLSGETPFDKQRLRSAAFDEVLRIIREEEPPRPSTRLSSSHLLPAIAASRHTEPRQLASQLRGELDWIVMKALEKDRNRRYETANGLVMDLLRYLHDEPVLACPPSVGYRVSKFARRNKRTLVTAALFGVLLLVAIGSVASIGGWALRDRTAQRAAAAQQIALDRAQRSAILAQEIEAALGEVALAYSHDCLADALASQKRAASLWASGSSDLMLQQRIDQWRADLQLAQRLDEIRLEQAAVKDGRFDRGAAEPAYLEAFQLFGLDIDRLPAADLAARIRSSAIRDRLVPALDEWLETRLIAGLPSAERLASVAALADGDPWRNRLRQASLKRDPKTLAALAQEADVIDHPATSLLLLASLLRGSGQLQPAIALLEQAQQQYPVDFWINQNLGLCLMQLPTPPAEKAIGYYRAAVTVRPGSPGVRVNLGNALRRLGRWPEAEREYRRAIELKPDYAQGHLNLGAVLKDLGWLDEAEREFFAALEHDRKYVKALANLGNLYLAQDRLVEAEFCCRAAVTLDPDDMFSQKTWGDVLLKLDRYPEAETAYRVVVRLDPRTGRAHQDLGGVLRLQGRMAEATEEFQLALKIDPRLSQSQTGLADVQSASRTPAETEAQLRAGIARNPTNSALRLQLGDFLLNQGNSAAAEGEYRETLRLSPELWTARSKLTPLLSNQGRFDELEALLKQLIQARPGDAALHLEYSSFLLSRNRLDDAQGEARQAVQYAAKLAGPHLQLAKLLMMRGSQAEAMQEFQTAVALEPANVGAHSDYAGGLVSAGRTADALAEYRLAIGITPRDSRLRYSLAELLAKSGRPAEAEAEFREAIRLQANNVSARHGFGLFLAAQDRLAEAEVELRQAVRQAPVNTTYRRSLIDVLLKQGKRDDVVLVYRDAVRQQPFELFRYQDLANYLESEDKLAEAEQVWRDAVSALAESTGARDRLAGFLSRRGKNAGAVEELQGLLRTNPSDAGLHQRLARALKEQGKFAEATLAAREAIRLNAQDPANHNLLADLYLAQDKPAEETATLRQLVALQPQDVAAVMRLTSCLQRQKLFAEAEAVYRDAIGRHPSLSNVRQSFGLMLFSQNKFAEAAAVYREASRLVPGDAYSQEMLGQALVNLGQFEAAEAELRKAIALNPDTTYAHSGLARSLDKQGRFAEAIAEYRQCVKNAPQEASLQYLLGNLLLRTGDYAAAEQALTEALRLRPQDGAIKTDLATVRQRLKLAADEPALRTAVKERRDDADAHIRLGNLLSGLVRYADAEVELGEAVRLTPNHVGYRQWLAAALSKQNKLAAEEEHRRQIVRLLPEVGQSHFDLGNALARQAKWQEAGQAFAKAAELDPANHLAWFDVTVLRLETGDVEGYRQASRDMLARFESATLPEIWERTAKTCLHSADGAGELKRALALAERAVNGNERHSLYWYFQLNKALAEYRAGNLAAAQDWLDKFQSRTQPDPEHRFASFFATGHAVGALIQHGQKRPAEAAASLAKAQALVDQTMPDGSAARPLEFNWGDWLRARLLTREAAAALAATTPQPAQPAAGK